MKKLKLYKEPIKEVDRFDYDWEIYYSSEAHKKADELFNKILDEL